MLPSDKKQFLHQIIPKTRNLGLFQLKIDKDFDLSFLPATPKNNQTLNMDLSCIQQEHDQQQYDFCDLAECINLLEQQSNDNNQKSEKLLMARELKKNVIMILEKYSQMIEREQKKIRQSMQVDYLSIYGQYQKFQSMEGQDTNEIKKINLLVIEFLKLFSKKQQSLSQSSSFDQEFFTIKDPEKMLIQLNQKIEQSIVNIDRSVEQNQQEEWKKLKEIAVNIRKNNLLNFNFRELRHLQKCLNSKEIKKLVKYCYLKLRILEGEKSESTRIPSPQDDKKKRFFDQVLKIKFEMARNHPGQKIMITSLYQKAVEEAITEENWVWFIKKELKS